MGTVLSIILYVTVAVFIVGTLRRVLRYATTPAPLKIPTTPAPQS